MKKALRRLSWIVLSLSSLVFAATFPIEMSFASRARLYQRVEPSAEAELFGEVGTKIGTSQEMIIDDPKALLPQVNPNSEIQNRESESKNPKSKIQNPKSPSSQSSPSPLLLDEKYLREHGIYPLQLKTVRFFAFYTRVGSGIAAFLALLALATTRRR